MPWSVQIARSFGIPIRLHVTFLLLLGWIVFAGVSRGDFTQAVVAAGIFACVIAHELGHALMARRFGVEVVDITLFPIGGVARMASIPKIPQHEFWIAIAGPLVNFVLGPLFLLLHRLFEPAAATADPILMLSQPAAICLKLGIVNLFMGVFNLIPAFPMDGGRILRALLARTMPYEQATARAAWLGQLLALVLAVVGLFGPHPMLVFVALFVFMAATEEGARAQTYTLLQGVTVREAMVTRFATLRRGDTLATAVELLLTGAQQDFPVVEQDQVVGVLTRARLLVTLNQSGTELYVSEVMESAPPAVQPETPLEEALEQFSARPEPLIPVVGPEGLCGLLTKENAVEVILVRTALYRNLNSNGH